MRTFKLACVGLVAVSAFAILVHAVSLEVIPNESAFPAAKGLINTNFGTIQATINAGFTNTVIVTNYMLTVGTTGSVSFVNTSGTTNTLIVTNGLIKVIQ